MRVFERVRVRVHACDVLFTVLPLPPALLALNKTDRHRDRRGRPIIASTLLSTLNSIEHIAFYILLPSFWVFVYRQRALSQKKMDYFVLFCRRSAEILHSYIKCPELTLKQLDISA